jgi:RNA polymerase sigma-70 factor (ECF subfamily)
MVDPSTLDDAAALRASLREPDAFRLIFDRHFDALHGYLRGRIGPSVAEDIAAETFTIAFDRRSGYEPRCQDARPWLFGIAANLIRRHRREEEARLRAHSRAALEGGQGGDLQEDAAARLDARGRRAGLMSALAELTPGEREALLLFAVAGLSYAEIATALGLPTGTVRSRLHRARRQVGDALRPHDDRQPETSHPVEAAFATHPTASARWRTE